MQATVPSPHHQHSSSQSYSSRRDHQSVSSTNSTRTSRSQNNINGATHPAVESAVTRLLVSIKQLLESLTQWSQLKVDENGVSDVYVRLGNDFNAAVAAFTAFGIDMGELITVPDDLRSVLEQCLAEDANPENLAIYLPTVRSIITNLLQGLRGKQSIYRRIVSENRHRSDATDVSRGSRSSRSHKPQASRAINENDPERIQRDSLSRRSAQASSRRREPTSPPVPTSAVSEDSFVGGFSPSVTGTPKRQESNELPNPYEGHRRQPSTSPAGLSPSPEPAPEIRSTQSTPTPVPPPLPIAQTAVPPSVKRYSLVDRPASPVTAIPPVVIEPSSPETPDHPHVNGNSSHSPPDTPPIEAVTPPPPAVANSLAALKKSETLERRASKRFSTYNISKMTGSVSRDRSLRGTPSNRRSMAVSSALTPGELAVLTEVDDEEGSVSPSRSRERDVSRKKSITRPVSPTAPPVPPLPTTPSPSRSPAPPLEPVESPSPESGKISAFLQLGREVKKVTVEPGLSIASLRMLFVDKFAYNPGQENFPAIYIRDPSSGVQYELEDMDEVKEKCLLSLNIEPLDQIKQHIDTQMSSLSQEIKDLRQAVSSNNRQSVHLGPPNFSAPIPLAESTPAPGRPTDRQFQSAARRLSRFVSHSVESSPAAFTPPPVSAIQPQMTGGALQPQMTGGSILSDYSSRVVTDLRTQFDEVQNLRRDLGIMRQLYTEFMKQTKDSLGSLRTQTQSVKKLADSNVGGARAYIDSGKHKLDVRSQNLLTEVEKLQDTVEGIKNDVLKKHITPKTQYLKTIKKDMEATSAELQSLQEHIRTIKPMWKKTWEEELQNIVEEQQFLHHQEEFVNDLEEDYKALGEIYGHVEKVISLRGTGSLPRNRGYRPPIPEEGNGSLSNVMLQIRGAQVDPEKRMKAIEASQKTRQKELESRSDDLQAELSDFVGGKKLRMTGGAEEVERVRQKRNDQTLKAMFTGGSISEFGSPGDLSRSVSPG